MFERREIVLDCETTGLKFNDGDRIVEIGAVELFDKIPTGREFHVYINPDKRMDDIVINIHGITNEFLLDKPRFKDIHLELLDFLEGSVLVAHNAIFDVSFINKELERIGLQPLLNEVIDTLTIARKLFYAGNSLDNLCKRYKVDNLHRKKHGALIDAKLLAKIYFFLDEEYNSLTAKDLYMQKEEEIKDLFLDKFPHREDLCVLTEKELNIHLEFVGKNFKSNS
jgi:DNA polymerase-3 subunit epsilon